MKTIFLNPQSCSGLSLSKWEKIKDSIPDLKNYQIVDNFYQLDWSQVQINEGDQFISAGGDGTLHSMINALIASKGLSALDKISFGHIGLGSNNSFLRPYAECKMLFDIAMRISDKTELSDLIEITINHEKKVYCVANASAGFLASANLLFNTEKDIAFLKRFNSDAADVYTFFKALSFWRPIAIAQGNQSIGITNLHFMKRPYYAADLGFPEEIPVRNHKFRFNILEARPKREVLNRFMQMLLFKKFENGRDRTEEMSVYHFDSEREIPIEADGEIYFGKNFEIKICEKGINLCR